MMLRELQYIDHSLRTLDLAEKNAERIQALAAARKSSPVAGIARMLFAPAMTAEGSPAEGRA